MGTHRAVAALLILALSMGASAAFGQGHSYEGTTKGAVISDYKPKRADFVGTKDAGPWTKDKKGLKPSVAVVLLAGSDAVEKPLLVKSAEILDGFLLSQKKFSAVPRKAVLKLHTEAGLTVPATGTGKAKAVNLALSTYDVVVFVWFGEGWLKVASYHALNKSEAMSHGISIYLGPAPTPGDVDAALKPAVSYVAESIQNVLATDHVESAKE